MDAEPRYNASSAKQLYKAAKHVADRSAAEKTRASREDREVAVGKGLFNRDVAVPDLVHGNTVNVRMHWPVSW